MQISKINSASFKGLWSIDKVEKRAHLKNLISDVYYREAVYHPFQDETPAEIEQTMKNSKKDMVYAGQENYGVYYRDFFVTKTILGERLSITKEQYEEIRDMKTRPHPISSSNHGGYFYPTSERRPEINMILNEIKE